MPCHNKNKFLKKKEKKGHQLQMFDNDGMYQCINLLNMLERRGYVFNFGHMSIN